MKDELLINMWERLQEAAKQLTENQKYFAETGHGTAELCENNRTTIAKYRRFVNEMEIADMQRLKPERNVAVHDKTESPFKR